MEEIKAKQSRLLEMLKQFDAFAKENDITYFVSAGTCLGAVREKGFIPWDADVDVLLPMNMYKKCESLLLNNSYNNRIKWLSYKNNNEAPNLMGRIYEVDAKIDNLEKYPYIDLFALAGMPNDEKKQEKLMKKSLFNYRVYWIKKRKYNFSLDRKKSRIGFVLQKLLFLYPSSMCIKEFEREMAAFDYEESDYVAPLTGLYGKKEVIPKKWFLDCPEYIPFCDMMVPVSKNVHDYLVHMYGENYMTPIQYDRYKE